MDTSCSNATLSDSDDEEEAKEVPDSLYSCAKRSHKRCVKTGVTIFIPPKHSQVYRKDWGFDFRS